MLKLEGIYYGRHRDSGHPPEDVALLCACYAMPCPEWELKIIPKPTESTDDASAVGGLAASKNLATSFTGSQVTQVIFQDKPERDMINGKQEATP